jgi:nucleoside-diphosphate-sugar epimerase
MTAIAVVGSGFIGTAVAEYLRREGHAVRVVHAPRLVASTAQVADLVRSARATNAAALRDEIAGCETVVNAAGLASATSSDGPLLLGANALLPCVVATIASQVGVSRYIHVSSAAVQGRARILDETPAVVSSSAYVESKALAEQALAEIDSDSWVILRPTSVHGPGRGVTHRLAALARSPWATTAKPGLAPTPQVHVQQVARAVSVLADPSSRPPRIVLQPSEGFTTSSFLSLLAGGRPPRLVPARLARAMVRSAFVPASLRPGVMWGHARRLEMLLFGQEQATGWLSSADPRLTVRHPDWAGLSTESWSSR